MKDLIERLERLDGPCRECDGLIWALCDQMGKELVEEYGSPEIAVGKYYGCDGFEGEFPNRKPVWSFRTYRGPSYTGSIDAAMSLVPKNAKLTFQNHGDVRGRSMWLVEPNERFESGATPAIALCIASLRSMGDGK